MNECVCGGSTRPPAGDGSVRVRREVKGRGGNTVTTISGLPLDEPALVALGRELRRKCGAGGSVKDGVVLVQGDHVELLVSDLEGRGYKVKRAGG